MDDRDLAFDLLLELADFTLERGLPRTSMRIEAALDAFLAETGRAAHGVNPPASRAAGPRPRRRAPRSPWTSARRA